MLRATRALKSISQIQEIENDTKAKTVLKKKSTKLSGYCSACVPAAGRWRAGSDFGVEL
jgi:hypothetical protein